MVAKINTSSNLFGALLYNMQKVEDGEARALGVNEMWESMDGDYAMRDLLPAFQMRLDVNNRTEKPIVHISLNPSPDDILSDEQLRDIAQEYMRGLGFGQQPYVVFKHEDIDRHHIHIVTTNIKTDGSKINDSNNFRRSKELTNAIESKYKLHPADIKQNSKKWMPQKVNPMNGRIRYQIKNITKFIIDNYKFQSVNELKSALLLYNVDLQEVRGVLDNGKIYTGLIYSATNDAGGRIANPIKASRLGKEYGIAAIENSIAKADNLGNYNKQHTRKIIAECISPSKSRDEFENSMRERGIEIYYRRNEAGRIYGATIIDHNEKVIVNGSKLGKELAANAFHALFEQWEKSAAAQEISPTKEKEHSVHTPVAQTTNIDSGRPPSNDYGIDGSSKDDIGSDALANAGLIAAGLLDALFTPADAPPSRYVPEKKGKKKRRKKIGRS